MNAEPRTPTPQTSPTQPPSPVRNLTNTLYTLDPDGFRALTVPEFIYTPLPSSSSSARLLTLYPSPSPSPHVSCTLHTYPVSSLPPFIAIVNARGYRNFEEAISISGHAVLISSALERCLRYLRTQHAEPVRIWVRYICVQQSNAEEQAQYWTREFSDEMYSRASETVDMHALNSRLIDEGYFERIVNSRYKLWTKEWHGLPGEVVLPRVCPIRLGVKASIEHPIQEYEYMPLDEIADEIRVMCVMPAKEVDESIVMHAAHCPMKCEVTYTALSYRWGTDETSEEIVLNGQKMTVRKNLASAIRAIRMKEHIVPIWIDAISINQKDVAERSRQVRRMGEIYDGAMIVYSYIGGEDNSTVPALELVKELVKHPMIRINDAGEFHFGEWGTSASGLWYGPNTIGPQQLAKLCAALYQFLTRQYFRRAWVLQEIAWASRPTIVAGPSLQASFDDLDMAAHHLQDMLFHDPSLGLRMVEALPTLESIHLDILAYPRKLFFFRHLLSRASTSGIPFVTVSKTAPGFLEALILARPFECSDPKDHIFALWSLAKDKAGLQFVPDYALSYEEVYKEFAKAWIGQHQSLDILGATEVSSTSKAFYKLTPSWCPDWNTPASASSLIRKDYLPARMMHVLDAQQGPIYAADGGMENQSTKRAFSCFEGDTLNCIGLIIDQVKLIIDDADDIPDGTIFPRCDPESYWKFHCWTTALERYYQGNELGTYDDPLRAAWAMFHGDSSNAWSLSPKSTDNPEDPYESYVCDPQQSRHILPYAGSYDRVAAWSVVKTVLQGRRPFISDGGFMGLAPTYLDNPEGQQNAVSIAVIKGCSVPLLLKEVANGNYQVVGSCFVQGWMEGEWIATMMGADDATEFWSNIQEGARLRII